MGGSLMNGNGMHRWRRVILLIAFGIGVLGGAVTSLTPLIRRYRAVRAFAVLESVPERAAERFENDLAFSLQHSEHALCSSDGIKATNSEYLSECFPTYVFCTVDVCRNDYKESISWAVSTGNRSNWYFHGPRMRDVVAFMGTRGLSLRTLADAQRVKRIATELSQSSFLTDQHIKVSDTQWRIGLDATSDGESVSYLEIDTDDEGRIQTCLLTFSP